MKKVYEKPSIIVEDFVPTQSVALSCSFIPVLEPIYVGVNEHICTQQSCGHNVGSSFVSKYDTQKDPVTGQTDGKVKLFNAAENCEYVFDTSAEGQKAAMEVITAGRAMVGNGSWNSDTHAMKIQGKLIPS